MGKESDVARCLRCGAGNEWIEGKVLNEPAAPQSSDGWIPVGERLPKIGDPEIDGPCDGTKVLFLHDGSVYTGWPVYPPDQWEMSEGGLGIFSGVTHWMPLPSPPEKDKP